MGNFLDEGDNIVYDGVDGGKVVEGDNGIYFEVRRVE